ncbi:hypothetical protein EC988_003236 [Linderina pennispora]|nr:hypothetical protein EC988_003236 [Linderina pennispora]
MGDDMADVSDTQDNTPLLTSSRNIALMQFINDETERDSSSPTHRAPRTPRSGKQQPATPRRNAQQEATTPQKQHTTPHRQLQLCKQTSPHSVTPGSTGFNHTRQAVPHIANSVREFDDDNDGMDDGWDDLDDIVLDSQTMRQVEESEEQFYATQQFDMPGRESLSQEFTGRAPLQSSRYGNGPVLVDLESRNARMVPAHAARSAPTTPTTANQGAAVATVFSTNAGLLSSAGARKGVPGYGQLGSSTSNTRTSPTFVATQQSQQPGYQRESDLVSSTQLPQHMKSKVNLYSRLAQHIPAHPNLPISSQHPPQPRLSTGNNHQKPWQRPPPPRSSAHHSQPSAVAAGNSQQRMDPEMVRIMDDLERLREENRRIQAEAEQLKLQLYTKEGEVKIVRENLARTEVENTHLQEQLANQIANVNAEQARTRRDFEGEIERLKTEIFFQQQEAQAAAMTKTPSAKSSSATHQGSQRSSSSIYPSAEDFSSMPHVARKQAPTSKNGHPPPVLPAAAESSVKETQSTAVVSGSMTSVQKPATNSALLDILNSISALPNAGLGQMISLSICLSQAVRDMTAESVAAFHTLACDLLCEMEQSENCAQLSTVCQLLLRSIDTMHEFTAAWLLDTAVIEAEDREDSDSPMHDAAAAIGCQRMSQLSSTIGTALHSLVQDSAARKQNSCGAAIASLCQLQVRLLSIAPKPTLDNPTWQGFDLCSIGPLLSPIFPMDGLIGLLELVTMLIQVSDLTWSHIMKSLGDFEKFLLAVMKRLRAAFSAGEKRALGGQRSLLVLIASLVVTHTDTDTARIVNSMPRFVRALVLTFLDEHELLGSASGGNVASPNVSARRIEVFCEHAKCLHVVLSEVDDVVVLLDGDNSPTFFGFVAACTRMTIGESVFEGVDGIQELAANLLAHAVTESQELSIQAL